MNLQRIVYQWKAMREQYSSRIKHISERVWRVLTLGLIEGIIVPKKCLSVSLEKGSIAIVYGLLFLSKTRVKGSRRYFFDEGRYAQPENLALAISMAIDSLKAHGAEILLVVPKEWVLVRSAELPNVVKENLSSVVGYELDRLTPMSPDEAMYDYKVYGEKDGKIQISIAAMRTGTIKPYLDVLKEKGITLSKITSSITCLGTLGNTFAENETLFVLSVGNLGYEGCLAKRGIVCSGFHGWFLNDDKERHLDAIIDNLAAQIAKLREEGTSPSIVVCNESGRAVLDYDVGIPVKILEQDDFRTVLGSTDLEIPCSPLGGLLEALRVKPGGFNLAGKGTEKPRRTPMAVTIALGCLILAMMVPYVVVPLEMEKRKLQDIRFEVLKRKVEAKKVEALKTEIEDISGEVSQIQSFKESAPLTISVLKELTTILPKNVWLTRSRITGETTEIEGYAAQSATELLQKLEQSQLFRKVEFSSPTVRDVRTNSDRFLIRMEMETKHPAETGTNTEGTKNGREEE